MFFFHREQNFFFFFFNDTATTEIYTLSLHDALPISPPHGHDPAAAGRVRQGDLPARRHGARRGLDDRIGDLHRLGPDPPRRPRPRTAARRVGTLGSGDADGDRKSTRLNSSH